MGFSDFSVNLSPIWYEKYHRAEVVLKKKKEPNVKKLFLRGLRD